MAAKPSEDPAGVRGQIEMLRDNALGNFRDILIAIAKDTAMLVWLDGRTNTKARPQENFGREIMELFTMGVGHYTEADVYAAARVFTGWNLRGSGRPAAGTQHYEFVYNAGQHDTGAKTFSFPIYPDGGRTIPGRSAADGMQDGLDFIDGARGASRDRHATWRAKLYRFFVSEFGDVRRVRSSIGSRTCTCRTGYDMKAVMREVLLSPRVLGSATRTSARYAWPVEFVVRAMKDIGWRGFSVNDALPPLSNMGQTLYDPPDVAGWDLGQAVVLHRLDAGADEFRRDARSRIRSSTWRRLPRRAKTPDALLSFVLDALSTAPLDSSVDGELANYLRATGAWTGAPHSFRRRSRASSISWPAPRSISSYEGHQTAVRQGRRRGVHGHLRRARVPLRPRAGAGRARPEPRRPVSRRRQRRAEHADSL